MNGRRLERLAAVALVAFVGLTVYVVATDLFPYLSVNDDEGVYLLQASMLLEGQIQLYPGALADVVRPWFFVVERSAGAPGGVRMYAKYSPAVPAMFALGKAVFDEFDAVLALVAAGNAAFVYALGRTAFDRRTGLLAVVFLVGSPLFVLTSATHLAYAPTTLWNLVFAFAYVRAARATNRRRRIAFAVAAGVAIGVAFFARPYTAVLFALPFIGHSIFTLARAHSEGSLAATLPRFLAIALPGLAFVGLSLAYNAVLTGDPLVFPYQAFAPHDGVGFGHREILGYDRMYTPALAAETTLRLLETLVTDWTTAGLLGTLCFLVGAGTSLSRPSVSVDGLTEGELRVLLAGVAVSVVVGNAYFWGTLNGLNNGLIDLLGPFYHFDLLVPLSVFGAVGARTVVARVGDVARDRFGARRGRYVLVGLLVLSAPFVAAAEADAFGDPVAENRLRTENLAATYEPLEGTEFDRAVVFTPDPYGDWQQHPFQYLRNDPGFDGDALYVLDEGPESDWHVLDAAAADGRKPYRFTYRGDWVGAVEPVEPALVPLAVLSGDRVEARTTLGAPPRTSSAWIRLETESESARYEVGDPSEAVDVRWRVGPDGANVTNHPRAVGNGSVSLPAGESEVDLVVTFVDSSGASITYRQELTVDVGADGVRVVWPPETRVCRLTTECDNSGTWVGSDGDYVRGVSVEQSARAVNATG